MICLKLRIQTRAPQPLYDLGMNFGVRFSYDAAQCTGQNGFWLKVWLLSMF